MNTKPSNLRCLRHYLTVQQMNTALYGADKLPIALVYAIEDELLKPEEETKSLAEILKPYETVLMGLDLNGYFD